MSVFRGGATERGICPASQENQLAGLLLKAKRAGKKAPAQSATGACLNL